MKFKVTKIDEMPQNSMKPVDVNGHEVLLVHTNKNNYYALDVDCPHEGAPLYLGLLLDEKIMCPWHHACFNCKNGNVIEPPALSDLNTYEISIDKDDIYIEFNETGSDSDLNFDNQELRDDKTFIIIGSGAAGRTAAGTLRNEDFGGKIIMINEDKNPSYDRTALCKDFLGQKLNENDLFLQNKKYFDENNIDLQLNKKVASLDTLTKTITLNNGENLTYDKLLIASGSKPILPYIPGTELQNIFSLRNIEDAKNIIKLADENTNCVIIGSSFIALEAASQLSEFDLDIVIVTKDTVPFENILGGKIGKFLMQEYKKKGMKFICETEPTSFKGNGSVKEIELSNGEKLNTDFVLVGIGVSPSTEFIENKTLDDDSLEVDEFLNFTKDVYAAGDLATYSDSISGDQIRIEHWRTAQQQGRTAALNMLGKNKKFEAVPFFQTTQLGQNIQYIGHAEKWDEIIIDGEIEKENFLAYYVFNDKIKAASGVGKDEEIMIIEELFRLNKIDQLRNVPEKTNNLKDLLEKKQ